jgi:MFS family permease
MSLLPTQHDDDDDDEDEESNEMIRLRRRQHKEAMSSFARTLNEGSDDNDDDNELVNIDLADTQINDVLLLSDEEKQSDDDDNELISSRGNFLVYTTLMAMGGYSILLPSMWSYVTTFGIHDESTMGWLIGIYCFGLLISQNVGGYLSNRIDISYVIGGYCSLRILGDLMYALAPNLYILMASRLIAGLGSADGMVSRSYLSSTVPPDRRKAALSKVSGAQIVAFIYGPLFASLFSGMGSGGAGLNAHTAPAYFQVLVGFATLALLIVRFRSIGPLPVAANEVATTDADELTTLHVATATNRIGMAICIVQFFVLTVNFALFETISTPITAAYYCWGTLKNGLLFGANAVCAVASLPLLAVLSRRFPKLVTDQVALIFAFLLMQCAALPLFSWLGDTLPAHRFIAGVFLLVGPGYVIAQVEIVTIYSQLIGSVQPGVYMGYITGSASIARIIGPLGAGYLLELGGIDVVVAMLGAIVSLTTALTIVMIERITPAVDEQAKPLSIKLKSAVKSLHNDNGDSEHDDDSESELIVQSD